MRLALALASLVVAAGPARPATVTEAEAMSTPCRTYLASSGSAIYGALVEVVADRLARSAEADSFGSTCNMADYVAAECKAHPSENLQTALGRLERAAAARKLPRIPMCGA